MTVVTRDPAHDDAPALEWERWEDPDDAALTWRYDLTHFPDVMTPLGYDLGFGPIWHGFGLDDVPPGEPTPCVSRRVNGYVFLARRVPPPATTGMSLDERLAALEALGAGTRWRTQVLPEVERGIEYYRTTDFDALDDVALAREIAALREARVRHGQLHTLALRPWMRAMELLVDTHKELTGGDGVQAARLVQGYGNKSVEAGIALWRLSRQAAALPQVRERLLRVSAASARDLMAELRADASAGPFVDAFGAFLESYGWRNDLFELAQPAWAEDPTIPLCQLRAYVEMEDFDPLRVQDQLATERDAFVAETLASLPPEQQSFLRRVLDAVRDVVTLQEDHNFYIDQRLLLFPRRLILAAGRRLARRGALEAPEQIFYLHAAEVLAALGEMEAPGAATGGATPLADAAEARRARMAVWATVTPPPFIGAPPPPPAPATTTASSEPDAPDVDPASVLKGNGGSAGVARGPARILRHLGEADRLRPGDVLVARTTMPPWTPLFAVASALVVEVGGVLSHPAVTAREYGLPAVLNVKGATQRLRDGQMVEVDGTRGLVRLLA